MVHGPCLWKEVGAAANSESSKENGAVGPTGSHASSTVPGSVSVKADDRITKILWKNKDA